MSENRIGGRLTDERLNEILSTTYIGPSLQAIADLHGEIIRLRAALAEIAKFRHTWGEGDFEEAQEIAREALDDADRIGVRCGAYGCKNEGKHVKFYRNFDGQGHSATIYVCDFHKAYFRA